MSWDVMVFSEDPRALPDGKNPPPLGGTEEVRRRILQSIPGVDWTDPAWGILDQNGYSIEFNHQRDGISESVMLHIRGGGDPLSVITKCVKTTGGFAFDTSAGELIDLDSPSRNSWNGFQQFRDRIGANVKTKPVIKSNSPRWMFWLSGVVAAVAYVIWNYLRGH